MKHDPFADPPTPGPTRKPVPVSVNTAAKVFFFVLVGTVSTVLIAVSVALWRWIV